MAPRSPADLLAALSVLMREYPQFAIYLRTSRDAVIGACSSDAPRSVILAKIADGCCSYADLQAETGFSASYLHGHLTALVAAGLVNVRSEPGRGGGRRGGNKPRKLYFLSEKIEAR